MPGYWGSTFEKIRSSPRVAFAAIIEKSGNAQTRDVEDREVGALGGDAASLRDREIVRPDQAARPDDLVAQSLERSDDLPLDVLAERLDVAMDDRSSIREG